MPGFALSDGTVVALDADGDARAHRVLAHLKQAVRLTPQTRPTHCVRIRVVGERQSPAWVQPNAEGQDVSTLVWPVRPGDHSAEFFCNVAEFQPCMCLIAAPRGGLLLHAVLVERDGYAIALAGPGNAGKTTTGRRLPAPWRVVCDDSVLVLPHRGGGYLAHEWLSIGKLVDGPPDEPCEVEKTLPLRAVFFVVQDTSDFVRRMTEVDAVCSLTENTQQGSSEQRLDEPQRQEMRTQRFHNACDLARQVPVFELHLTLHGEFWHELDRVLLGLDVVSDAQ